MNRLVEKNILPSNEHLEIYFPKVKREHAYGCETFALKDAVLFHLSPHFFEQIGCSREDVISLGNTPEQRNYKGCSTIRLIEKFPPTFMKGTQSCSTLEKYMQDYPELADQPFPHRKKGKQIELRTLRQCMQANIIRGQNHYTTFRSYKNHATALKLLKEHSGQQLLEMIGPVWVGSNLSNKPHI